MMALDNGLYLDMAMATDIGKSRQRNEDEVRIYPEQGLAILADGMGGHQAGDVAAKMAVEVTTEEINKHSEIQDDVLVRAVTTANDAIRAIASTQPEYRGMGSTIVVTAFTKAELKHVHVGDSRLYRYWNNTLQQLTVDHTLAQQYINEGLISVKESKTWAGRNLLTKGLGIDGDTEPDAGNATLARGQTYLLCSDGLTDPVSDEQITEILSNNDLTAEEMAEDLVALANENGGPDNISVVVARLGSEKT